MVRAELIGPNAGGPAPLKRAIELARRADRLDGPRLQPWIGDCAWRLLHAEPAEPPQRYELASFARRAESEELRQVLADVRHWLFTQLDCELDELLTFATRVRLRVAKQSARQSVSEGFGPRISLRADPSDQAFRSELWARLAEEESWQAERLLLRTALLPTRDEVSVTLDQLEAEGRLPSSLHHEIQSLRARVSTERNLPLDQIFVYLEHLSPLVRELAASPLES